MISTCLTLIALMGVSLPSNESLNLCKDIKEVTINPEVALVVVAIESAFNPKAESPALARGLMQMTPIALKEVQRQVLANARGDSKLPRNIEFRDACMPVLSYNFDDMYEPIPTSLLGAASFPSS